MPRVKTKTTKKVAKSRTTKKKVAPKKRVAKAKKEKFFEAIGRRKTAAARVRLFPEGGKGISVNGKEFKEYFPNLQLQEIIKSPLNLVEAQDKFGFSIKLKGGGVQAQAEAVRHGIAKTLILFNLEFRQKLKKAGFLTRDPRMRERKRFGLKRARRAPQWSKR